MRVSTTCARVPATAFDESARRGGDAAHAAEQIEHRAFAGEQHARRPVELRDDRRRALTGSPSSTRRRACVAPGSSNSKASSATSSPAMTPSARATMRAVARSSGGDDRIGRDVAAVREIFEQRGAHERLDHEPGRA